MYTFMSINGSSGSCHPRRDAELIPICNRLLTDLHVIRKMKVPLETFPDTLTVALTATIPINPENIHAYTYELKQIFTTFSDDLIY